MRVHQAKIVIVDSNRLFRAGLISLLTRDDCAPIAEAENFAALQVLVADGMQFDLVLIEARPSQCACSVPPNWCAPCFPMRA